MAFLFSGGTDKTVRLWDARAGEQFAVATLRRHTRRVDGLQLGADANTLISSSRSASVGRSKLCWLGDTCLTLLRPALQEMCIWDLRMNQCTRAIQTAGLTSLRVAGSRHVLASQSLVLILISSASPLSIATGHTDRTLKIWDSGTGELQRTLVGHTDTIQCLQFDRQKLITGSRDCTVRLWDPDTGKELNRFRFLNRGFPSCLAFNHSKLVLGTCAALCALSASADHVAVCSLRHVCQRRARVRL